MSVYQPAHRRGCCGAITALGRRIGLYAGNTRVDTPESSVYADSTWGAPVDITEALDPSQPVSAANPLVDKAQSTGSTVTLTIPGATVANGTIIDGYGIFNGATLLRRQTLPVSLIINDGSQTVQVDVTPVFTYRGE